MHTATAILVCDIANLDGKILFKNEIVRASAIVNLGVETWDIDYFEDDTENYHDRTYDEFKQKLSDRETKYNSDKKYKYALILDEFSSGVKLCNATPFLDYDEFVLLVINEDIEDIEVDDSMFERCGSDTYKALREATL